jgi:hypothetical protein
MSTLVAQTISNGTVSTSSANVINGCAKAWVTMLGNNQNTVLASYNVSSVTLTGTVQYRINFTNAFVDNNYCFVGGVVTDANSAMENIQGVAGGTRTTTAFEVQARFETGGSGGTAGATPVYCAFFR